MNNVFNYIRSPFVFLGIMGLFLFVPMYVVDLYTDYKGDPRIWWTNSNMKLAIDDVSDKVEVYIGNELLQKKIANQGLLIVGKDGSYRLVSEKDLKFRVNNWANVRLIKLRTASINGIFVGASIALFIIGLLRIYRKREIVCPPPV